MNRGRQLVQELTAFFIPTVDSQESLDYPEMQATGTTSSKIVCSYAVEIYILIFVYV